MNTLKIVVLTLVTLFLFACAEKKEELVPNGSSMGGGYSKEKKEASKYLAYEHSVAVEVSKPLLQSLHAKIVSQCMEDRVFQCVVLDSVIRDKVDYASGSVRLRLLPQGINRYVDLLSTDADVVSHSSKAEDLADVVVENQKRLDMLRAYRDRLQELESEKGVDIDSLLKIASELSAVQSKIEYALGKEKTLLLRVQSDLLNIEFSVPYSNSNWGAIRDSLSGVGDDLAFSTAEVISFTASFVPWFVLIVILLWVFRWVWAFFRRKSH